MFQYASRIKAKKLIVSSHLFIDDMKMSDDIFLISFRAWFVMEIPYLMKTSDRKRLNTGMDTFMLSPSLISLAIWK